MTDAPTAAASAPRGGRRWPRRVLAVVVVAALAAVAAAWLTRETEAPPSSITASSTAAGTSAASLLKTAEEVDEPEPVAPGGIAEGASQDDASAWHEGDVTWASNAHAKRTSLELTWESPITVSHVRLDGAGGTSHAYSAAIVSFDDGSAVWVTPDAHGNVSVDIAARTTASATIRFVDGLGLATSVALRAVAFDASGDDVDFTDGTPATSDDAGAESLADGDIGSGDVGTTWREFDESPWAGYTWQEPTAVSSVQIVGASGATAAIHGTLEFSDGSSVVVSGVTAAEDGPTTIAFTSRTVTWARFVVDGSWAAVSELRFLPPGTTPATWPWSPTDASSTAVETQSCDDARATGGEEGDSPTLVCPDSGSAVEGSVTLVVGADPGSIVTVTAYSPETEAIAEVATAATGDDGTARLALDTSELLDGPMAVRIDASGHETPLYVQLVNLSGIETTSHGYTPAGMTLQYEDDFTDPLSVSSDGAGSLYASTKPAGSTGSEFSDAVFADPDWDTGTLTTLDSDYLRITLDPLGSREDPYGWDRDYLGGLVSSARVGASGFSAQYGYFEARILAPAGLGTWSAFWMLDTESARAPDDGAGEVDALELYGAFPTGSCHTLHNWPLGSDTGEAICEEDNGAGDWALSWHTYGVLIRPNGADMYIDGELVAVKDGLDRDALPYYFLLNLAAGGGWPIDLATAGGHAEMYVDWVRVST